MKILENHDLKNLNTFAIQAYAKFFVEITEEPDLYQLFLNPLFKENKKLFLGEGSNILLTGDFDGIVVKISIPGIKIIKEDEEHVLLEVGAGENWHKLVTYVVSNNWGGIENLALIPGTVGAAPVQNIAAYGGNLSDVFDSLYAFNVETGVTDVFNKQECKFGYRDSIFKRELRGKYIITRVRLLLSKNPTLKTSYYQMGITRDSIREELEKVSKGSFTIKDVYQAVVNIRTRKLPDPVKTPTVGSFFLNSVVSRAKYEELKSKVSELQCYPPDQLYYENLDSPVLQAGEMVKVATGRLLQELGWLGKWEGNVGIHDRHALVIVTNGKASGEEVVRFAEVIRQSYLEHYGIPLEVEVNLI